MVTNTTNTDTDKVVFKKLSFTINGLCFNVHNSLGRYRNEKQYADALEELFKENKIEYLREYSLPASFNGEQEHRNRVDFLVADCLLLELKAKTVITKEDYFQMQRYLSSSGKKLGIIVNFRQKYLIPKRILN